MATEETFGQTRTDDFYRLLKVMRVTAMKAWTSVLELMHTARPQAIALYVFVLLAITGILIRNIWPFELGLNAEEWAAWVQAIGSLLAILIAIAVPFWQRREELRERRRDEEMRARSLAKVLIREFQVFGGKTSAAVSNADRAILRREHAYLEEGIVPKLLIDSALRLHLLGEAGDQGIAAMYEVRKAEELLTGRLAPIEKGSDFRMRIAAADGHCHSAIKSLGKMLSDEPRKP